MLKKRFCLSSHITATCTVKYLVLIICCQSPNAEKLKLNTTSLKEEKNMPRWSIKHLPDMTQGYIYANKTNDIVSHFYKQIYYQFNPVKRSMQNSSL